MGVVVVFDELEDAMLAGVFSGEDGGPGDGAERREDRVQGARGALADEAGQVGHLAVAGQWAEDVPGGPIEAEDAETHQGAGSGAGPIDRSVTGGLVYHGQRGSVGDEASAAVAGCPVGGWGSAGLWRTVNRRTASLRRPCQARQPWRPICWATRPILERAA